MVEGKFECPESQRPEPETKLKKCEANLRQMRGKCEPSARLMRGKCEANATQMPWSNAVVTFPRYDHRKLAAVSA